VDAFFDHLLGSELAILFTIAAGCALTSMRLFPSLKTNVASGIVSLQLAWTSERAAAIVGSWRERHLEGAAKRSLYVDYFLYIPCYTAAITFLALLTARAVKVSGLSWFSAHSADLTGDFTAAAAWIAGTCDCLENVGLLRQLGGATDQPVPALTSTVSMIKWVLALAAALFSLTLLIASAVAAA
jgi:hypothetical protein